MTSPTYDSRQTGPRYHVTSTINNQPVVFQQRIDDPFVRHTIHIGWRDLLRALLRRRELTVEVTVGGDRDVMEAVLELDANYLGLPGSARRAEFNRELREGLAQGAYDAEFRDITGEQS